MDYSENRQIWPGSSSFEPGKTPFGFFDSDVTFQQQADSFAKYAAQYVGYPIMDVELVDINFYTAFESAVIEYSNQINQVNIINNLVSTLGMNVNASFLGDGGLTGKLVGNSLGYVTKLSKAYGTEAGSGGSVRWHSASFELIDKKQTYSIREAVEQTMGTKLSSSSSIEIKFPAKL